MRLAKSQAHQPFPGFFKPGFLLSNHRCKSLLQGVCPDSNRAFSLFGQMCSAGALFERRFSGWQRYFPQKNSQRFGRRFVGPDGLRKRRLFSFQKGRWSQRLYLKAGAIMLRPYFLCTGGVT